MQVHLKESLGRVIRDSKVVWCLKYGILAYQYPLHCYLSMINWIVPNLHVVIPIRIWRALDPGSDPGSSYKGCEQLRKII